MHPEIQPQLVELTQSLIRLPSVLGGEDQVARQVVRSMESAGFDQVEVDEAGNAVGVIDSGRAGPTILLDAHMDTVDVTPRKDWSFDPFGAQICDGRIYGRGSSDMKGALAAMLIACARLRRSELKGRVVVSASVSEESIEGAALKLVMDREEPDLVVIGESTELNLACAGRGRAEFLIDTRGQPSHASAPHLGRNAVHSMSRVIAAIEDLPMPSDPFVGEGVMCLTDIISLPYPAHSVVPSGCRVTYERRLLPGETLQDVTGQLNDACIEAGEASASVELAQARGHTYTGFGWDQPKWFPPWEISQRHPLVQQALAGVRQAGLQSRLSSYQFCTNAAYSAGEAGVPTVGFGPSSEEQAHMVDEFVEIEQLENACRGYQGIIRSLLGAR